MPLRGGAPPELQQLAQLGGVGQQAAPQVPGLLQLAQAAMDGGGGARGGGGGGADHSYYGDISSQPGMSDYYDPTTHIPRMMDATTAAAQGGTTLAGLAGGFFPHQSDYGQGYNIPSDQGGFFNAADLYQKLGRDIPSIGTFKSSAPSTNNWRLLGMGPGWIMRNGALINTKSAGGRMGGPAAWVPSGGNSGEQSMPARATALGGGLAFGVPNMLQAGLGQPIGYGWPGQDQWFSEGGMLSSTT